MAFIFTNEYIIIFIKRIAYFVNIKNLSIMSYFSDNYNKIQYSSDLRNAQIGAIHSIASHFTTSKNPAMIIMPTGTGKTSVLMMSPFVLKSNRVLVITPSKLVRNQISIGFSELQPLRKLNVFNINPQNIKVKELKHEVTTKEDWEALIDYHIVVSTPNCVSPGIAGIFPSLPDFFDLILIDEAHHTPAKSWVDIINHYPNAKKVLFTATPFRRDKKDIPGKIIYNYPISLAYEDGIFGQTEFVPVDADEGDDIAIAHMCEQVYKGEPEGIVHYIMIRTDSKKRAHELERIYSENTSLRLKLIHSGLTAKTVENTLTSLRQGNLDGIICVDMLGEGFDFPNLKIAAIHSPHKSLAATLQFIGRFTRTNAENISHAKFIAIPSEIAIEKHYLYRNNSVWRDLIIEMSENKIETEVSSREMIDKFQLNEEYTVEEFEELSLNSIEPYHHVKIYAINNGGFVCDVPLDLNQFGLYTINRRDNVEDNISVLILQEIVFPKWSKNNSLQNVANHLIIIYYDEDSSLLFINSTIKKSQEFYDYLRVSFCPTDNWSLLSDRELNSVLANIDDAEFFNIGMRNRSHYGTDESYRIITGSTAHNSITKSDANIFHRGHLFGKGSERGLQITIGLSSSSKVWSHKTSNLLLFINWAKRLAYKINERLDGTTNTPIDYLPTSTALDSLPTKDVVAVNWHESAFKNFTSVQFSNNGQSSVIELTDIELIFNHNDSDDENYRVTLRCQNFILPISFSFNYDKYFISENGELSNSITVYRTDSSRGQNIIEYINLNPLTFYYSDFSMLYNNNIYLENSELSHPFISENLNDSIDWGINGVNITNECNGNSSIHQYFRTKLSQKGLPFVYYDHGSGEIADFITAELNGIDEILVKFYHCKGSDSTNPGNRVNDVYEVLGQGVKSLSYTNPKALISKLKQRQGRRKLTGTCNDSHTVLSNIISNNAGVKIVFQVILVQPGITKSGIESRISRLLSFANNAIRNTNNCKDMIVICSS